MDVLFTNVYTCYLRFRFVFKDYKILEFVKCTDNKMDVSCGICGLNALK